MEYKLSELFDLEMGKTPSRNNSSYWENGTNDWISIADLTASGKYIEKTKEKLTDTAIHESGIKVIPADTVVMSFKLSIGKVAITPKPMYSNEAIMAFHDKHVVELIPDYIYYLFKQKNWLSGTNKAVMGKTLNKSTMSEMTIDIVPIDQQKKIVRVLDKTSEILANRKKQLRHCDTLVKSRFVEMFGDPISNSKSWKQESLSDVCEDIKGGGTPSKSHPEYFEGNIPWVSPKDMKTMILYDTQDHITEEAVKHSTTNIVPANSVLMVIRSGVLKHDLPVAMNMIPVTINQDMKAFIPGKKITSEYLMYYFKAIEPDVLNGVRAVTADNIDFKVFQKRKIITPPLDLQNQFSDFVHQVDKSKSTTIHRYCKLIYNLNQLRGFIYHENQL